ncbi:unnamed protein product [marine sediment metagenome]|uniref:Uncharacterized protein n=1 Tax=marine sediment metagenome TaxID=412755 RepID=X1GBP1_9ZZZZ
MDRVDRAGQEWERKEARGKAAYRDYKEKEKTPEAARRCPADRDIKLKAWCLQRGAMAARVER